ncbi:MAG: PmoA family protein [Bacteroidales bacterium]|nr:PmoA family protein [Bacteroidales bacterium]
MKKLFIPLLLACIAVGTSSAQQSVTAERIGNHIDVMVADKLFTSYRFLDDEKYPFFFPVNGPLSGASVTGMRNALYPHQASLFIACDRLNGANYWQEGLQWGRIVSLGPRIVCAKGSQVVIEDECVWKRPGAEASVRDKRTFTISSPDTNTYQIDLDLQLEMLCDVTIEKTIHSLVCARMAEDLSVRCGGVVGNSVGKSGIDECFGEKADWVDYYGFRKTGTEGIAIMQHPLSDWYPAPWFIRDYGLFSPSIINWPANGKATSYPKGTVLHFRYRILVHGGTTDEAGVGKAYKQFTAPTTIKQ